MFVDWDSLPIGTQIHCDTEDEALQLFEILGSKGYFWGDGSPLYTTTKWTCNVGRGLTYYIGYNKLITYSYSAEFHEGEGRFHFRDLPHYVDEAPEHFEPASDAELKALLGL